MSKTEYQVIGGLYWGDWGCYWPGGVGGEGWSRLVGGPNAAICRSEPLTLINHEP